MCGIAGWAGDVAVDAAALTRMTDAIHHRGPDSEGTHVEPGRCAIGFRRLSIIDLECGSQPLLSEDGRVVATCNGEIYNFAELRDELRARGHEFRTGSDCEVIPHAYEEWGLEFVDRLRGMFGIALWDGANERLVLVRDRLGKKPVYYAEVPGGLLYASEPASILAAGVVEPRPDPIAIGHFLALQYVPAPRTGFEGIAKLAPGEMLVYEGGESHVQRYWTLEHEPEPISDEDALDQLESLVRESTNLRLVADVPLGAFLSGGIDSSIVVSFMAEAGGRTRTFAMDFAADAFSEGAHAKRVADLYGTEHETMLVEPDMVATTLETIRFAGEPFADQSVLPTYLLAQMTKRHVTVALSGDGGDEAFGGYRRHKVATYADRLGPLAGAAGSLRSPAARLPSTAVRTRADRWLQRLATPPGRRYGEMMSRFPPGPLGDLCEPEFVRASVAVTSPWEEVLALPDLRGVERYCALDTRTYLPGAILTKVDRMSMAHALEVRSPLLDHNVYEFAARLPARMKLRRGTTKWLLRQLALRRGMPEDLVLRPKQGFGVPLGAWFRTDQRQWITDLLLDERTLSRGYFQPERLRALVEDHVAGRHDKGEQLWSLAMLELWHRQLIEA
jgi:asparagine synthase (glutamine-hydrolysing)